MYLGQRAESSGRQRSGEGYESEGVRGLKALGVRDLTYRLAFLACSVQATNPRVGNISYCHVYIFRGREGGGGTPM